MKRRSYGQWLSIVFYWCETLCDAIPGEGELLFSIADFAEANYCSYSTAYRVLTRARADGHISGQVVESHNDKGQWVFDANSTEQLSLPRMRS